MQLAARNPCGGVPLLQSGLAVARLPGLPSFLSCCEPAACWRVSTAAGRSNGNAQMPMAAKKSKDLSGLNSSHRDTGKLLVPDNQRAPGPRPLTEGTAASLHVSLTKRKAQQPWASWAGGWPPSSPLPAFAWLPLSSSCRRVDCSRAADQCKLRRRNYVVVLSGRRRCGAADRNPSSGRHSWSPPNPVPALYSAFSPGFTHKTRQNRHFGARGECPGC